MKKYLKFLLLVSIFALVGIFNFSSAYNLTQNFGFPVNGGTYSFPSSLIGQNVSVKCEGQGKTSLFFECGNNSSYFSANSSVISLNLIDGCLIEYYGGANIVNCSYSYQSDTLGFNQLGVLISPVVSGLNDTFNEFIPYIVYIGLGILSVIIGFVAIKWLINWVRAKVLGTFKR